MLLNRLAACTAIGSVAALSLGCPPDEVDPDELDIVYVSANPPDPGWVTIQGTSLNQQDWEIAEPPRPDYAHVNPTFSPDGELIAYERRVFDAGDEVGRLFVVDPTEGAQVELSDLGHDERCRMLPRGWHPDGEQVAFVCDPVDSGQPRQIGWVNLEGETTQIEPDGTLTEFTEVRWSSDDDLIAVASRDDDTRALVRIDPDDVDDPEEITTFEDDRFIDGLHLSDDGTTAAMIRATDETSPAIRPHGSVIVADLDDGTTTELLADDDGATAAGHHSIQRFHPDGERLLVATGGFQHDPGPLRIIDIDDDNEQTTLADDDDLDFGTIRGADISPDADLVVFSDNDSDEDDPIRWREGRLHTVGADGDDLQRFDELSVPNATNQPAFNPEM